MRGFLIVISLLSGAQLLGQSLQVAEVSFVGLHRTKAQTLLRIIGLKKGDQIDVLDTAEVFQKIQMDLYNTKLFTSVSLSTVMEKDSLQISISFIERWYTYATPKFDLIDRNFNEWWVVRNRDLTRIIAGLDFTQKNSTGRNDDISFSILTGYQQKGEIAYKLPYHFLSGKLGIEVKGLVQNHRSVNYITANNQLQFAAFDRPELSRFESSATGNYFATYNQKRWLSIGYHVEQVSDDILDLSPDYMGTTDMQLKYGFVKLGWQSDTRDVRGYANTGSLIQAELSSFRFIEYSTLNFLELRSRVATHIPITKKWNIAANVGVKWSPDKKRPYFLNRGLGWDVNRIRNYDYYVVDGSSYVFEKVALRYKAYDRMLSLAKFPIRQFRKVPLKLVPKAYFDFAYVVNKQTNIDNSFTNQSLMAVGMGLDIVLYDDAVWRLEFGRNHLGEAAFFLNFTSAIQ